MHRTVGTIAIAAVCLVAAGTARQNPPQPVPRFRAGIDLVVLDVSVLDRNRVPVGGLTAADFTIFEDGRPQEVSSFTAVELPDTERKKEVSAAWLRDVSPDVQRNDDYLADRGVFVIVLDDATPMPGEDVAYVKKWARAMVERLGPDAIASVVFTFNQSAGQEFTQDRARLLAAIDRFNGSIDLVPEKGGAVVPFDRFALTAGTLYRLTVGTLRDVAERLAGLPQRRKALVFISVGVPLDIGLMAPALIGELEESTVGAGEVVQHLLRDLQGTLQAAQRANVNIYSLDPGGLRAPMQVRSPLIGQTRLEGNPGMLNREFLATVSESTGGFAVVNTNDAGAGITQIFRENASYYLLGYNPSNPRAEGRYRRLEVRVNRPGVAVRARNGYYEPRRRATARAPAEAGPSTPLDKALAGPVPSGDLSLRVTAAPFALPGVRKAALAIVLGVRQPAPPGFDWPAEDTLEVLLRAHDVKGRDVASDRLSGKATLRSDSGSEVAYEVISRLDLEPGRYHLRVAAQSALQGKSGSVYCDVDVPDFSKLPVSLSGVAISPMAGLPSGPKDRLRSLVPVVPTAEREFETGERVTAFLRVYQGGSGELAAVMLAMTVRNARGAIVFERAEKLERDRFSAERSTNVHFELPISSLNPGSHLVTIEATLRKRTARRDVRLAIR
jgi:VWFA-related protein